MAATKIRRDARSGGFNSHTTGLAPGHVQANLLVLSKRYAPDFAGLCARNPVTCPLIGSSLEAGDPNILDDPTLFPSGDIDIRTDIPKYNVYEAGQLIATKDSIREEWSNDSVAFLIGCSYSFERALADAGLTPRAWEQGTVVSMYQTQVILNPSGIFAGACQVVSMRPYRPEDIERVRSICRPYLKTHGEPIDWGWDALQRLGIKDIDKPDFGGGRMGFREGEVPVFWGCGVTPQAAVVSAGNKIEGKVMAHTPGHMLVLDLTEEEMFRPKCSSFVQKLGDELNHTAA